MKKPKQVKVVSEAAAKPCPKCGYCEHCGRSNQQITIAPYVAPYIYPQPWYPYQSPFWVNPQITWGGTGGVSSGTITVTSGTNNANQSILGGAFGTADALGGLQGNISTALGGAAANLSLNA